MAERTEGKLVEQTFHSCIKPEVENRTHQYKFTCGSCGSKWRWEPERYRDVWIADNAFYQWIGDLFDIEHAKHGHYEKVPRNNTGYWWLEERTENWVEVPND